MHQTERGEGETSTGVQGQSIFNIKLNHGGVLLACISTVTKKKKKRKYTK